MILTRARVSILYSLLSLSLSHYLIIVMISRSGHGKRAECGADILHAGEAQFIHNKRDTGVRRIWLRSQRAVVPSLTLKTFAQSFCIYLM